MGDLPPLRVTWLLAGMHSTVVFPLAYSFTVKGADPGVYFALVCGVFPCALMLLVPLATAQTLLNPPAVAPHVNLFLTLSTKPFMARQGAGMF